MKIAGLDIGTTGCKITVFDSNGEKLGRWYAEYPVKKERNASEIDPSAIRDSVFGVISRAAGVYPDVEGIGVTSFGESCVLADENGSALFPIILYTDPRGKEQCDRLTAALGKEKIEEITGLKPHEMYSLPKILWCREHAPETFSRVRYALLIEDYVAFLLTGKRKIDYSLATRSLAFDVRTLDFSDEILSAAELPRELFSEPCPSGTVVGTVLPEISDKFGLSHSCRVVAVAHDQVAACVGAGVFEGSVAVDGAGTVECITPVYPEIPPTGLLQENNYNVVPYLGKYVSYAFSYTGGELLHWFVHALCGKEAELAQAEGLDVHQYLQKAPYEITGLLVLPHFAGAATPYMDTGSRGAILGMTTATTASDLYYACMEGVAYEMRLNAEKLRASGIRVERLRATGGGARSRIWTQIKADVLGIPVDILETEDAGTVGSAMLTGVAIGLFPSVEAAAEKMVKVRGTVEPRPEMTAQYDKIYGRYEKLYDAVRPLM